MTKDKSMREAAEFGEFRKAAAARTQRVDVRKLYAYSAYLQGAMAAILTFCEEFPQIFGGKDAAYNKAVVELATASLRNTDLFLTKEHEIRFRNHVKDKKGKCVKCEAYFADRVTGDECS